MLLLHKKKKYIYTFLKHLNGGWSSEGFVCSTVSGESSHPELVSEDDEPFMDKQGRSHAAATKPSPGARKYSLPQQIDLNGLRQVSKILFFNLLTVTL